MKRSMLRSWIGHSLRLYPAVRTETADGRYVILDFLWRVDDVTVGSGHKSRSGEIVMHEAAGIHVIRIPTHMIKEHVPREAGEGVINADDTIAIKRTPIIGKDGRLRFEGATKSGALLPNAAEAFRMTNGRTVVRVNNPSGYGTVAVTYKRLAAGEAPATGKYLMVPPPAPMKNPQLKTKRHPEQQYRFHLVYGMLPALRRALVW